MFKKVKSIHFIGIGGIGMSGIAELLNNLGFKITGSDLIASENVVRLESLGINISIGHDLNNLGGADAVVYSSAVPLDNPEILSAINDLQNPDRVLIGGENQEAIFALSNMLDVLAVLVRVSSPYID